MTEQSGAELGADIHVTKSSEIDLADERERQIQRFLDLGFHDALGVTAVEYRESIPNFVPHPETDKSPFNTPILVDPRIPISGLLTRAELVDQNIVGETEIVDLTEAPKDKPYGIWTATPWVNQPDVFLPPVAGIIDNLGPDQVGSTFRETVALFLQKPEVFKGFSVTSVGSRSTSGDIPKISGKPHPSAGVYWDTPESHAGLHIRSKTLSAKPK